MGIEGGILRAFRENNVIGNSSLNASGQYPLYINHSKVTSLDDILREGKPIEIAACPHPDDAEIGIGAYIAKYCSEKRVIFIYVTNGVGSLVRKPESRDIALEIFGKEPQDVTDEEVIEERRKQAEESIEIIGASAGIFLGYDSIKKPCYDERTKSIAAVSNIISLLKPQRIFVPQLYDQHLTHLLTTYTFARALNASENDAEMLSYCVWGPIPYGIETEDEFVSESHIRLMREALRAHRTEAVKDYGESSQCMMRSDAIVSVNEPDSKNREYLLRLMRLDYLKDKNPVEMLTAMDQCILNQYLKKEFSGQFEVR